MTEKIEIVIHATDKATEPLKQVSKAMGNVKAATSGLKLGFTEVFSAVNLAEKGFRLVKQVMDQTVGVAVSYARSVSELGLSLGITTEEASALYQIADDLKIPVTNLEMAFKTALKNGVQPSVDGLKDLSKEYQAIEDPVKRAQFAMDVFGMRAGPQMQKLLEATPEAIDAMAESAEAAGLIMSQEGVDAAREYEIALDDLSDAAEGVKISFGNKAIPAVTDFLKLLTSPDADHAANFINQVFKGTFLESELSKEANNAERAFNAMTGQLNAQYQAWLVLHPELRKGADGLDETGDAAERADKKMANLVNDSLKPLTTEMLNNKIMATLTGGALLEYALATGQLDQRSYGLLSGLQKLTDEFDLNHNELIDAAEATDEYKRRLDILNGTSVDTYLNEHQTTYHQEVYLSPIYEGGTDYTGDDSGRPAYHSGADFIVPPGYPNDSYPIQVESGERVIVIPKEHTQKNNTYNFNYSGNASQQQIYQAYEMARLIE